MGPEDLRFGTKKAAKQDPHRRFNFQQRPSPLRRTRSVDDLSTPEASPIPEKSLTPGPMLSTDFRKRLNFLLDEVDAAGSDNGDVLLKLRELYRVEGALRDIKEDADAVVKKRAAQKKRLAHLLG